MAQEGTIFESSIRKAVKTVMFEESNDNVERYIKDISNMLMFSIRKLPSRDQMKRVITDLIEEV